jgi:hypothetical protein
MELSVTGMVDNLTSPINIQALKIYKLKRNAITSLQVRRSERRSLQSFKWSTKSMQHDRSLLSDTKKPRSEFDIRNQGK